jgi:7-cyano-7-deazaguanine reductase
MPTRPDRKLVTFPNPSPGRDYVIRHECPEYTAVCPVTGQPDFGTIVVHYTPEKTCIELKSLKLYLWSFRDEGHYFEQATNQILDDLVRACLPRSMTVVGRFNVRGGIGTTVVAHHPDRTPAGDDVGAPRVSGASARPPRATRARTARRRRRITSRER